MFGTVHRKIAVVALVDIPLFEWFNGTYNGNFVGFLNRNTLTTNTTYAQAVQTLSTAMLIAPVYLTVGGVSSGEGVVLTRNNNDTANFWFELCSVHLMMPLILGCVLQDSQLPAGKQQLFRAANQL